MKFLSTKARLPISAFALLALVLGLGLGFVPSFTAKAQAQPVTAAVPLVNTAAVTQTTATIPLQPVLTAEMAAMTTGAGCAEFKAGPGKTRYYNGYTVYGGAYLCRIAYTTRWVPIYCALPWQQSKRPTASVVTSVATSKYNNATNTAYLAWVHAEVVEKQLAPGKPYATSVARHEAMKYVTMYFTGNPTAASTMATRAGTTVRGFYDAWISAAKKYAGTYAITVSAPKPGYKVNQVSALTVKVVATRPSPDVVINNVKLATTVTGAAVKTSASTTTGTAGATVKVTPTKWGGFSIAFAASGLPNTKVTRWYSISGYQEYINWAPRVTVKKTVNGTTAPGTLSMIADCPGCDGYAIATNSSQLCNTDYRELNIGVTDNGVLRPTVHKLAPGVCLAPKTINEKILHDHTFQAVAWLTLPSGPGEKRAISKAIKVDCPPWPVLKGAFEMDCYKGKVSLSATAIPTRSGKLILNGKVVMAAAGQAMTVSTDFDCSVDNTFTFQRGSQKIDGTWNMGKTGQLVLPAGV